MKDLKVLVKSADMVTLMMELDTEVMVHTEVELKNNMQDMEDMEVDYLIKHTIILDTEDTVLDYHIKIILIQAIMMYMMIMVWMLIVTMEWVIQIWINQ